MGAVVISTDGTAQIVDIYSQDYVGKPNTTILRTETSGVSKSNFVYSNNPQVYLTAWDLIENFSGFHVRTTYHVFAVGWGAANANLYLPLVVK